MANQPQTYANHRRFVPMFHGVTFLLFLANLIFAVYHVFTVFSVASVVFLLTAIGLILLFLYTRLFAAANQDRIIRLEERLRLERLLSEPIKSRIGELTTPQLVGLRFASDDEVGGLVQRALDEKLDREAVKKLIKEWRPDYQRV